MSPSPEVLILQDWQDTGVCHGHPPELQSKLLEQVYSFQFGPSAEDTYEHVLSPSERRGLSAPVVNWRVYTSSSCIKSNIGEISNILFKYN